MYKDPSGRPNQYTSAIRAVGEIIQVGLLLNPLQFFNFVTVLRDFRSPL
jgi:hypothetical protein